MVVMIMVAMMIFMAGVMMIWGGCVAFVMIVGKEKMRVKYEIESMGLDLKLLTVFIRTWCV